MKNYGDITKINGSDVEITDVVIGGSPCQDLSIAGLRKGLEGERSGLFMEQIRLIKEMRNECRKQLSSNESDGVAAEQIRPRYMVWENVCGAYTSNGGEDFRAVLEETAKVVDETVVIPKPPKGKWTNAGCIMGPDNRWSIAWRTHDAQFWGVPQRRKRISLVADFAGGSAPEVLFIGESLSRDIKPCGEKGQGTSGDPEIGIRATGVNGEIAGCLDSSYYKGCGERNGTEREVVVGADMYNLDSTGDKAKTLTSGRQDTHNIPTVYGISSYDSNAMKSPNPNSGIYEADTSRTLDNNGGNPACNQGGMMITENCLNPWDVQSKHIINEQGVAESLYSGECRYGGGEAYVLKEETKTYDVRISSDGTKNFRAHCYETDICRSLDTAGENPDSNHGGVAIVREPVLLESNQNHATIQTNGVCTSLPAAMGEGGGYIPMITEPMGKQNPVCIDTSHADDVVRLSDNSPSLQDRDYKGGKNVLCFEPGSASRVGGHIYDDSTGAVRANAGDNQQAVMVFENHSQDTRYKPLGDVCQTVSATYGIGGNNQPLVVGEPKVFDPSRRHNYEEFKGVSETVQAAYGTGGNNVPMVLNQMAFRKTGHPQTAEQGQGWEETDKNDTLNVFDNGESRTPTLVLGVDTYNQNLTGDKTMSITGAATDSHHIPCALADVAATRSAQDGRGGCHSQMLSAPECNFVLENKE